jgi:hypothetical protein
VLPPTEQIVDTLSAHWTCSDIIEFQQEDEQAMSITRQCEALLATALLGATGLNVQAWDHPGHMTTAAIAFAEIERANPELIPKIGGLMLKHPDPAPFWVATVGARGDLNKCLFIRLHT